MRIFLSIFPIALLMAYSQIIVKWRALQLGTSESDETSLWGRMFNLLSDPLILSAYVAGLLASFIWLFVLAKLPLVIAFPVYIGVTFVLVLVGGWVFLSETITLVRILAASLILSGIVLGVKT